ncbi:uncharacterized protein G2W53_001291 [Senna tora]|uniref:Uncharacterized protein n=1 Tax=Senna tora TaxID=362788 RepID=A0A834XIC1_9FABA|nr:uncharacterized protein G2W53_001291 [Senna tora]
MENEIDGERGSVVTEPLAVVLNAARRRRCAL